MIANFYRNATKLIWVFCALLTLQTPQAQAQHELTMPFMHNLMQGSYTNPTLVNEYKAAFAFAPVFPSAAIAIRNTGFGVKDMIRKGPYGDSIYLPTIIPKLKASNYLYVGSSLDLFVLMLKREDWHWSFNVTEQANVRMSYPDNFARFVINGNYNEEFYQKETKFKNLGVNAVHYREYGVGLTVDKNHWVFGGRAKLLFGKSNAYTSRTDVSVFSADTLIRLNNDIVLNTSYPDSAFDKRKYLLNSKNIGLAFDGGISYKPAHDIKLTLAFNNVGFINWKSNVTNRRLNANVAYSGVKLQSIILQQENRPDQANVDFQITNDSLADRFNPQETHNSYRTPLVGQSYFLVEYELDHQSEIGTGVYMEYFQGVRTSWTLNYQRNISNAFNIIASYSIHNRSYDNIGLGVMARVGSVQLYFAGDNLIGIARGTNARNFNMRFGLNFVIGRTLHI